MSKLIVYNEGKREVEYVLDKERIRIGRKIHNDIQLPHNAVSGEHALIITIRNDSFLEDLHSTNGVRVNNKPVKKCVLQDGDEIGIAKYKLKYIFQPFPMPSVADGDLFLLLESGSVNAEHSPERAAYSLDPSSSTTHAMIGPATSTAVERRPENGEWGESVAGRPAAVHILSAPGTDKELELTKTLTTLGKPGVQMAVITRRTQGYFLTHLEGSDFPLLNGSPIGTHSRALNDHDIIDLAGTKMEFFFK